MAAARQATATKISSVEKALRFPSGARFMRRTPQVNPFEYVPS